MLKINEVQKESLAIVSNNLHETQAEVQAVIDTLAALNDDKFDGIEDTIAMLRRIKDRKTR